MKEFSEIILTLTILVFGIFLPMNVMSAQQESSIVMLKSKMSTATVPPGNPDDAPPPGNPDDAPPPGNPDDAPPGNPDDAPPPGNPDDAPPPGNPDDAPPGNPDDAPSPPQ